MWLTLLPRITALTACNNLYIRYLFCFVVILYTGVGETNESAPASTVEDAAAVTAISKQQILVQYLKVTYTILCLVVHC